MNKYIGTCTPFGFEGYLLIAFSDAWRKIIPNLTFDVAIINDRLVIKSNQRIQK